MPYMPISWGGLGGECTHIWHTWSVWDSCISFTELLPGHLMTLAGLGGGEPEAPPGGAWWPDQTVAHS